MEALLIGFSDEDGRAVTGEVYRPINGTYTAGTALEGFLKTKLNAATNANDRKFLTSNGGISPFIKKSFPN